jgi:chromosome segregation ATPase
VAGRLPTLDSGMDRLAAQLATTEASFKRVAGQVETIKTQAPEIALSLEGQRQGLGQRLAGQRQTMDDLDVEINTLKGGLNESRGALSTFRDKLDQDLAQAKQQTDALAGALADARASAAKASGLVAEVDARVQGTERELEDKLDAALAYLAAAADRVVQRGEDAIKQAEADAAGQLDAAAKQAIEGLSEARRQRLAELGRWAEAAQGELARTQAGVVAGWQGMDAAVAERKSRTLASLDQHAATLENRVQELLDALNVMVSRSSG